MHNKAVRREGHKRAACMVHAWRQYACRWPAQPAYTSLTNQCSLGLKRATPPPVVSSSIRGGTLG